MKLQDSKEVGMRHMQPDKWQQAYIDVAHRFAELSSCERRKVGAIIVKDNRIISIGYNGTPAGWDNCCEVDNVTKPEVIHAEQNAIAKLAKSNESGLGAEMYVTCSPCVECAKQIYGAGITRVYYKECYKSNDGIKFLNKCNVETTQI
jgi:dCMP deaminase